MLTTTVPEIVQECFGIIYKALVESRSQRYDSAKKALAVALLNAVEMPEEFLPGFRAAMCCCMLIVKSRESPASVTAEMHSEVNSLLSQCGACNSFDSFQTLMFEILTELGEHRRALPYGERGLAIAVEMKQSVQAADWLWKIGRCYSRLGLRDHAVIAFRGSVRIFRNETADPRLPAVLLALGNSIRKSKPSEAEQLYKEAAALWEKKGQLESATPAWMNLGIVCSDQGRFEETIQYYERVRAVRESSPRTPPVRIGVLYNNLASCYRKMARFAEAHQAIERSIRILTELLNQPGALGPDDANSLALSLGTKGMILRDQGRDLESLEWFRRACAELERQPSPNLDFLLEELEHQSVALTRLSRTEEVRAIEERIESARKTAAETPAISQDGGTLSEIAVGALLIEVDCGLRSETTNGDIVKLGTCLDEILQEQNLGGWQGLVRIPESTTLIYYGSIAEAMYDAVAPTLRDDARFEGALVTVRQGTEQREVMLPRQNVN